ncbi:double-stranded RNA-specific editase Adar isoform X5 [Wyeomyia smithii]|uniref:double-stranded RNA-specific editase Adar isoform X5 n=1 Tax=Wyeomyia smithii TaxID=174621 RepID=UPI002467CFA6|nr:double-stranded RNA-specific editase Adar isoform X5 [Wyeomyia smithii]
MRPNATVYDRYRWKKMDQQQPADRKSTTDGTTVGTGQKVPLLTPSTPTTAAAVAPAGTPPSATAAMGGTPGSSPSRRGTKRKSSVNPPAGSAAARKRRKLQQAQLKAGEPSAEQVPQTKNTVAVLNELKRNLVYNLESQTGPVHAPLFSMSVVVDGQKFIGHGRSKKLARIEAAAAALRSFIQFKDGATLTPIKPLHNVDFTSDDPMIENSIFPLSDPPELAEAVTTSPTAGKTEKANNKASPSEKGHISRRGESKERQNGPNHNNNNNNTNNNNNNNVHSTNNKLKASAANASRNVSPGQPPKPQPEKGPVMLLHELFTDATFECVSTDGLQHSKFTVVVSVDGQRFEGTGPSKKMAKNAAAKAALASMCNISFSPLQQAKFGALMNASGGGVGGAGGGVGGGPAGAGLNGDAGGCYDQKNVELPQTFADSIGKLVIEKFNEVMKGNDVYSRRKVLAGIVMTQAYDVKTAKVISLATGTKCVSGEHMSVTGSVINDSHAEIIARRGLLDYFYSQLDLLSNNKNNNTAPSAGQPVAQYIGKNGNNNRNNNKSSNGEVESIPAAEPEESIFVNPSDGSRLYKLRDGINFHLYINTAPCGDARVFSPHENDNMDVDKHPNRKARGQLRTKVESGEGTIPVKSSEGIQTWDGVLQGQRLLTMSCSDKISRWNVLGLQGSLLASVIEPIYLHSIVLGSLLHPAHMYRAICGRVENSIQGLPPPYRLNKPRLALMTSAESRNQTKPPNFSINWVIGCQEVEIVNSFTGKLINNNTNTTKMSRLSKQSFYRRFAAAISKLPLAPFREVKPSYFETKMSVPEYQQAKKELFAAFAKEDLGDWLKKPIEQDQFTLIAPRPEELLVAAAPLSSSGTAGAVSNSNSNINNGTGSTGAGGK